jgi:hypothetical protein
MKRLIQEPLVHFLLLGAAIFAAYEWLRTESSVEPDEIVITRGQIEHLSASFAKTWQRSPSADELTGLVRDRIREEVYCREALALGLDQDDTFIRRRLRQKMEFVSDDIAVQTEPSDDELFAYLKTHPDSFRVDQKFSFRQVYLNPENHGENLEGDAEQLLARLSQTSNDADVSAMGDPLLLEFEFFAVPSREVTNQFGRIFAERLPGLKTGQWQGPVESGYGLHLVFIGERTEGRMPDLAEVRDTVRREWDNARRLESNEKFYQELLKRYTVTIEGLKPATEPAELVVEK